jgi:oxygen-independent coproporphyrinogen-3 oxidase
MTFIEKILRTGVGIGLRRLNGLKFTRIEPDFTRKDDVGLYIHIPFCKRFCTYCAFQKFAYNPEKAERYVQAVKGEIDIYAEKLDEVAIGDVYFGGGTPSLIPEGLVEIADHLRSEFKVNGKLGFEANPDDVDDSMCDMLRDAGFSKVSMGIQTFNDGILKEINRRHDSEQAYEAIKMLMEKGFYLSIDLLFGLPNQTLSDVMGDLEKAVELNVPQICPYAVMLYPHSKLYRDVKKGLVKLPSEEVVKKTYYSIIDFMTGAGYDAGVWEFRKRGIEGKDYATCTRPDEVIGIGASAYSMLDSLFYFNTAFLEEYMDSIAKKRLPIAIGADLSSSQFKDQFKGGIVKRMIGIFLALYDLSEMIKMKGPMMELARRGVMKRTDFEAAMEKMAGKRMAGMWKMMLPIGIMERSGDDIRLTKRGNYYASVMAGYLMPGQGRYGEDVLVKEPWPEWVFEFKGLT